MQSKNYKIIILFLLLILPVLFGTHAFGEVADDTTATTTAIANELQSKIDSHTEQIKRLEEEIKKYNAEAANANDQAQTLQSTIKTLDLTKKKISTDINLTQKKISKTILTLEQLNDQIEETKKKIATAKTAVIVGLQNISRMESTDVFLALLSNQNLSEMWTDIDNVGQIREGIRGRSRELADLQNELEIKQESATHQKKSLVGLKQDLSGQKKAVEATVQEKAVTLAETKNKEQTFKQLVKQREEEKAQFEAELYEFESQLHIAIDKNSYPAPHFGILSWPLDKIRVTQRFGKTVDSVRLYKSGTHSGVDFAANIGTPVKTVDDGFVAGTGNTDLDRGCSSFGKWILIQHKNGLSTAYGHLSVISVATGQTVKVGDVIGYSGKTGHVTGPHLHITLYATQGVKITSFPNSKTCDKALLPIADTKAYLDPLAYFPSL